MADVRAWALEWEWAEAEEWRPELVVDFARKETLMLLMSPPDQSAAAEGQGQKQKNNSQNPEMTIAMSLYDQKLT